MLDMISANLGTIIVALVLAVIVGAIVVHLFKNKKEGKSSCGCGCGSCPMSDSCHSKK